MTKDEGQRNDETRMTKSEGMTKHECRNPPARSQTLFDIRHSDFFRHSTFDIRHSSLGFRHWVFLGPWSLVLGPWSFIPSLRRCGTSSKCSFWVGRHLPGPSC